MVPVGRKNLFAGKTGPTINAGGIASSVLLLLFLPGVLFFLPSCSSGGSKPSVSEVPVSSNVTSQREFPAFVYNSVEALRAYEAALQFPEVLALMPCYCNCGEASGHKDLGDCFFKEDGSLNDHAAFCDICVMEVADISKWQKEGYSLSEIRQRIDQKYRDWGEPTDTPPILQPEASPAPASELAKAEVTSGPRISFAEDSVNLGEIPPDIPRNYAFRFRNTGNLPLNIIDTRTKALAGCCPPNPVVGSTTLQPGEESTLLIGVAPHSSAGLHIYEITVKSNDPVEPEKKLYLEVFFQQVGKD